MKRKNLLFSVFILTFLHLSLCAKTISIYHTGDVHGWYSARKSTWLKENPERDIGGFPALASLLKKEKNPYILLDSGDMFQGTPEGDFTKGMLTAVLMNQLGYSAVVVGNHDYDYGEEGLKHIISSATFSFLGANVYYKTTGKRVEYLKPYVVVEKEGKRIGILGLAGRHTSITTLPTNVKHLKFADEVKEAYTWTQELKKQNVDVIIILVHEGINGNFATQKVDLSTWTPTPREASFGTIGVARNAKSAHVVIGAHMHTGIINGYFDRESSTLIAESLWGLAEVTKIDLEFDDASGKFKHASARLVPLWIDETGEDESVIDTIKQFSKDVDKAMDKVIGVTEVDLGFSENAFDFPIGNWITDALKKHAKADVAFQNVGGIRSDIKKGEIRVRDVYHVMPFANTLVRLTMTGAQLEKLMRDNIRTKRSRMQVSGMLVKFKTSGNGKISEIHIERNGKKIKPDDRFTVVTNNYLTSGGSGGKVFAEGENPVDTMIQIRDILIREVERTSPIKKIPDAPRIIKLE